MKPYVLRNFNGDYQVLRRSDGVLLGYVRHGSYDQGMPQWADEAVGDQHHPSDYIHHTREAAAQTVWSKAMRTMQQGAL